MLEDALRNVVEAASVVADRLDDDLVPAQQSLDATPDPSLEPLVNEYTELQRVAQRLGIEPGAPAAAAPERDGARNARSAQRTPGAAARTGRRTKEHRSAAKGNAPGSRHEDDLALVREHPGITVTELGRRLDVAPTSLYRVVRRLEQQGRVSKTGRTIQPT